MFLIITGWSIFFTIVGVPISKTSAGAAKKRLNLVMEKIIDDFFSLNAIASEQAKQDLIAQGEECLDLIIAQFYKRSLTPYLAIQLGDLFGHFGNASLPKLMSVFKEGKWGAMIMATPCF